MPRAIWTGTISFGLVNVPVRMYSAIAEARPALPPDPRARRWPDRLPEDLQGRGEADARRRDRQGASSSPRTSSSSSPTRTSTPRRPRASRRSRSPTSSPTRRSTRSTSSGPTTSDRRTGGEKVYALLRAAMEQTELAADRQVRAARPAAPRLPARARGRAHAGELFFHDEIRPLDEIAPRKVKVPKAELELATALIEQFTGSFEPESYEDTYREALCDVIKREAEGQDDDGAGTGAGGGAGRPAGRAEAPRSRPRRRTAARCARSRRRGGRHPRASRSRRSARAARRAGTARRRRACRR